jgi:RHH-type proline utilization regulon transcriptional repressor/proline dehydrogenase/delta 1-pyrroline-5-carboxylate dehydrogenase
MQIAANSATTFVPFDAFQAEIKPDQTPLRAAITAAYRRDETEAVQWLLAQGACPSADAKPLAHRLVSSVRAKRTRASGVDALMHEFSLSSEEGVALMCLAEALLRIPDSATADRLIADKISRGDWRSHLGESPSLFVNAATWGLLITGKLVSSNSERGLGSAMTRLIAKGGEPLIRKGVDLAMRMLGNQFVTGQTIGEALKNSQPNEARGYQYSYDMLGEAALTEHDAQNYYASYEQAIHAIGRASNGRGIKNGPGISIKLSALHPRYSRAQSARVMSELLPRVRSLVLLAKGYDIGINIDAEEADRLEISLDMLEALAFDPELAGFEGIGLVVQGYQKRCPFVIDYVIDLAKRSGRKFMVRLVKGAYWDAEIKRAQVDGMPGFPVYTRKVYTDVSYLTCAEKLLGATDVIYAQFATHNAHTLSVIYTWAKERGVENYEFQCLHGMGETLYDQVVGKDNLNKACRIYAPVGSHETLLAYLVRRLLENGANSSFVNQIVDEKVAIETLLNDPFEVARTSGGAPHTGIALPRALFGTERKNSAGIDLTNEDALRTLGTELARQRSYNATPLIAGALAGADTLAVLNPAQHGQPRTRRHPRPRSGPVRSQLRRADGPRRARSRQIAAERDRGNPRSRRLPALLRCASERCTRCASLGSGHVHLALELPARHLYRPGRRGPRCRQRRAGETCRTDAIDRAPRRRTVLRSRHSARRPATAAGPRRSGRCRADCRCARQGRDLHRVDRSRAIDQPHAGETWRKRGYRHSTGGGNRWPERPDCRFLGAAGTGRAGRIELGLRFGRPALLGAACAVPAGRYCG